MVDRSPLSIALPWLSSYLLDGKVLNLAARRFMGGVEDIDSGRRIPLTFRYSAGGSVARCSVGISAFGSAHRFNASYATHLESGVLIDTAVVWVLNPTSLCAFSKTFGILIFLRRFFRRFIGLVLVLVKRDRFDARPRLWKRSEKNAC